MDQGGRVVETQYLVSVITPSYNSGKYIADTIRSVRGQSYENWEMIIVDDGSTDNTCDIVSDIASIEKRITLIRNEKNLGAAASRNKALHLCKGRFIAYLDADDLWEPKKIEYQVAFMLGKSCGFSCVSYEVIDDEGGAKNKNIYMKNRLDYKGFLHNNLIQTVGVMFDRSKVPVESLVMPNISRRQDAATWLQVLKIGHDCYGIKKVLAKYRRTKNSLSSNKFIAASYTWKMYRKIEKLPFWYAIYIFARYAITAVWKRL